MKFHKWNFSFEEKGFYRSTKLCHYIIYDNFEKFIYIYIYILAHHVEFVDKYIIGW